ncbi:MAG: aldose 1-epimerase [Chloroflexota bacterium]
MPPRYGISQDGNAYVLVDHDARAEARIVAAQGNNVTHFRVTPPGLTVAIDVLLPPSEPDGLGPSGYSAGNPILFPFPNRVREGKFTFDGQGYQLDVNETARGNHIHGLVSTLPWRVEAAGASPDTGAWQRASMALDDVPDVARQYPFPCRLTITTRLAGGVLIQEITAQNTGDKRLPMGFGTHPWFPAVLGEGTRPATEARVPGNRYWRLEHLVPTGETIPVDDEAAKFDLRTWHALDENDYDDVFTDLIRRDDGWSEAGIRYPNAGLELIVEASPEFREWVIYAPTGRPVICLEPYTGTTNAVNLQNQGVDAGLVVLEPGAAWTGTIRTSLRRPPGADA